MAVDWRRYVDPDQLATWMNHHQLGAGPVEAMTLLTGGTQNILVRFARGGRDYILRRPTDPANSRVMVREARILTALAGSDVPAPALIARCHDDAVLGAAFYLMEPIDGFNATQGLPSTIAHDPSLRHRMGIEMADGIAALGRIDHERAGLGDLGRLDGYLERQTQRWLRQLDSYRQFEGWAGPDSLPSVARIAAWLEANRPATFRGGLIHGDYHLSNVLFDAESGALRAVVDWELATVGDPLQDLGLLLATWPDPLGGDGTFQVEPWDGFPDAAELIERYAAGSSRSVDNVGWYAVLGCLKMAVVLEGTQARAAAGRASRETGAYLHGLAVDFLNRTQRWM